MLYMGFVFLITVVSVSVILYAYNMSGKERGGVCLIACHFRGFFFFFGKKKRKRLEKSTFGMS